MKALKLTMEWVPATSGGKSLNKGLSAASWRKIREEVYAKHGQRCAICGAKREDNRLDCHEVWDYDDEEHIQRLTGFLALCYLCHRVKHGLWLSLPQEGEPEGAMMVQALERERKVRDLWDKEYQIELARHAALRNPKRVKSLRRLMNRRSALKHFLKVNGCDLVTGEQHILEALEAWKRRSQYEWQIDFEEFVG